MADTTKYVVLKGAGENGPWTTIGTADALSREKALEMALPDDDQGGGDYRVVPESAWGEVYSPDVAVERVVSVKTKAKAPKPAEPKPAQPKPEREASRA